MAALFTLFVVPTVYTILARKRAPPAAPAPALPAAAPAE